MSVARVSGGSARAGQTNPCCQWDTMMLLTNFSPHITVTTVGTQPLTQWPQFGVSPCKCLVAYGFCSSGWPARPAIIK